MAYTEELPDGRYRGVYRDTNGAKRRKTFTHKGQALTWATNQENAVKAGSEPVSNRGGPTWSEWRERWERSRTVEPSTIKADAHRIDVHIEPRWGDVRLRKITNEAVQSWVNDLGATGMAGWTVRRIYSNFSSSLTAAVRFKVLGANPCAGTQLPAKGEGVERFLTHDEINRVLEQLGKLQQPGDPWRTAVIVAAHTGTRWGELAGLHWHRVDLDAGTITLHETYDSTAKRIKPYTKDRELRTVPLSESAADALREWRATHPPKSTCTLPHASGRCRSSLVFAGPRSAPALDRHLFARGVQHRQLPDGTSVERAGGLWFRALRAAGVAHARLYDLRHTYASWLIQAGVPLSDVAVLMGHSDQEITRLYAHLAKSHHGRALAALNAHRIGGEREALRIVG